MVDTHTDNLLTWDIPSIIFAIIFIGGIGGTYIFLTDTPTTQILIQFGVVLTLLGGLWAIFRPITPDDTDDPTHINNEHQQNN